MRGLIKHPNVILVITDDQGYGDLGCTGNSRIHTPNIDQFYQDSVRFTDFHVAPMCAPTRGGIMTGRRPLRNGVWATCWGRSLLKQEEYTLAECFQDNGYITGLFGKWHLGDNYPYRPQDRGFTKVVAHKGGGVGQTPDFWGNHYFDDTYFDNSVPRKYEGYCTDIWFEQAMRFMKEREGQPFFTCIATNAPHSPYLVEERYSRQYQNIEDICYPEFYGMITCIDENFGRLRDFLREENLEEDTILIFMTDNGTSGGAVVDEREFVVKGFNAGMRGKKGSYYEGGHRVPFFIRCPGLGISGGRDCNSLSMYTDIMPTLISLCGLDLSEDCKMDGTSFARAFSGIEVNKERIEFIQYHQDTFIPEKWENTVLKGPWRLVRGKELYNIEKDTQQIQEVSGEYPEITRELRKAHEDWWEEVKESLEDYCPIILGHPKENPTTLNAMDVLGDVAWSQDMVAKAAKSCGRWPVRFSGAGKYIFKLRRWPAELQLPLNEEYGDIDRLAPYKPDYPMCHVKYTDAWIKLDHMKQYKAVKPDSQEISFELEVNAAQDTVLEAGFLDDSHKSFGAYYVEVEKVDDTP